MGIEKFAKENIRRLVSGARDKGFIRTWLEIRWATYYSKLPPDPGEEPMTKGEFFQNNIERLPFVYDMYYIDPDIRHFYFYEIEDTHTLTSRKMQLMDIWITDVGDECGWRGRVIVTDRYGLNHRLVLSYEDSLYHRPEVLEYPYPRIYKAPV